VRPPGSDICEYLYRYNPIVKRLAKPFTDLRLLDRGLLVAAVPVSALVAAAALLVWAQVQEQRADAWVRRSFEVRTVLQQILTFNAEMETSTRGYILTKNRVWLESYRSAAGQLPQTVELLESLVRDNPREFARAREVKWTVHRRIDRLKSLRNVTSGYSQEEVSALFASSKQAVDEVAGQISIMQAEEGNLLESRVKQSEDAKEQIYATTLFASAVGIVGAFLGATLFTRGLSTRVLQLQDNARRLADRRPLIRIAARQDEIGQLSAALEAADSILAQRERELHNTKTYLEHLIESSPVVVFEQDPLTMIVKYVSPNIERELGYTREQMLAAKADWLHYVDPEQREEAAEDRRVALSGRLPQLEQEYRLRRMGGQYRWFYTFIRMEYGPDGTPAALIGHALDITRRKEAEEASVERDMALAATNRELEAFSYSVSHDLRAPLRSIDGFSLALLEDCSDQLDETGKGYLARIRAGTRNMSQLIDDLLNLSRLTRTPMRMEAVDLTWTAQSVIEDLRRQDPARKVDVLIAPGLKAWGDPGLLRALLQNLLGNAWKFTSKHSASRIGFGADRRHGKTVYYVRDNGAGFDQAYAGKLFGAFQRLHGAEFAGTGVGLATVQRIVHRHGGQVWAEGQVEKGATFYFTLPSVSTDSPRPGYRATAPQDRALRAQL
jgi:PAS domain S-box-containing protein